jgi:hypothetical protein
MVWPVLGPRVCKRCDSWFNPTGPRQKYCAPCGVVLNQQWKREYEDRKREIKLRLSERAPCRRCGAKLPYGDVGRRYCPSCRVASDREKQVSRRQGYNCRLCGKRFAASTGYRYCSPHHAVVGRLLSHRSARWRYTLKKRHRYEDERLRARANIVAMTASRLAGNAKALPICLWCGRAKSNGRGPTCSRSCGARLRWMLSTDGRTIGSLRQCRPL